MSAQLGLHLVDLEDVQERILPTILGDGDLEEIARGITRRLLVRHRAWSWALALLRLQVRIFRRQSQLCEEAAPILKIPGPLGRLFGRKLIRAPFETQVAGIPGLAGERVLARPFFITSEGPEAVCDAVDRYRAARTAVETDAIAREMLRAVESHPPEWEEDVADDLREIVAQETNGLSTILRPAAPKGDPGETCLAVLEILGQLRENLTALPDGRRLPGPYITRETPRRILAENLPIFALDLAAVEHPYWSPCAFSPHVLLAHAGIDPREWFERPAALVEPFLDSVPELETTLDTFRTGGLVPPDRFDAFLREFEANRDRFLLDPEAGPGWDREFDLGMSQVREAASYARRHGLALVEARDMAAGPLSRIEPPPAR